MGRFGNNQKKRIGITLTQFRYRLRIAYRNRDWNEVERIISLLFNTIYIVDYRAKETKIITECLVKALEHKDWQEIKDLLQWLSDIDKNSPTLYMRKLGRNRHKAVTLHSLKKRKRSL